MGFMAWLTRNWADTDEGNDPDLTPLELRLPFGDAFALVEKTIGVLRRWRIESIDSNAGLLHATRRTKLLRFVDDILLRLEETPESALLHAHSQSRVGKGDFGQNRRNILELFNALRAAV